MCLASFKVFAYKVSEEMVKKPGNICEGSTLMSPRLDKPLPRAPGIDAFSWHHVTFSASPATKMQANAGEISAKLKFRGLLQTKGLMFFTNGLVVRHTQGTGIVSG